MEPRRECRKLSKFSKNPNRLRGGGASESCIDWLKIDVTGGAPVLLDQQSGGAFGSSGDFRYYPDISVDRADNIAIGYTKSSTSTYTELFVTGREFGDPAGELQVETLQRYRARGTAEAPGWRVRQRSAG